jgi:hypothetical protein
MVEASEDGRFDDAPVGVGRELADGGDLLPQPLVRAIHVEVARVFGEHALGDDRRG